MNQHDTNQLFRIFSLYSTHPILQEVIKVKDNNESIDYQNVNSPQDETMNRVNQTFDKIKQEVKNMIDENNKASDIE